MIKGSPHQEETAAINIYAPQIRAPKYMKQTFAQMKGETDSSTVIVDDLSTTHSITDRTSRQNINEETEDLNSVIDQRDLIQHTTPSNSNRIRIFLKYTKNIQQDRSHVRSQNKS